MSRCYVSTPIYYVNDLPHIGHVYTTVVADTIARYHRLAGDEVFFLTGTDEHGQNIERTAAEKGITPQQQADSVVSRYHRLWRELEISHDDFIRTTEPRHRLAVEELIRRIEANGDLYEDQHEGWYCASCESFYTEKELLSDNRCPDHERPVEWKSERNLFFRLSRYQEPLLELYAQPGGFVHPETRANEVRSFVAGGLRDISVSRAGPGWGIAFPSHPDQLVYVWLDALTNYLSALGFGADDPAAYERFWSTEADGKRVHLIGKDILRFHAVWWPAFLMSAGLPLPTAVVSHGWWLRDEKKVSKTVGNVVRPDDLMQRFGTDPVRYFLLREMVFGQDARFSDEAFVDRFNSDLANDLGNTVSRLTKLSQRTFDGRTPPEACGSNPLIEVAERAVEEYHKAMREHAFQRALTVLWSALSETNQYLVERAPWKLIKDEGGSARVARILWNGIESVRIVTTALAPFMPCLVPEILKTLGCPAEVESFDALAWGGTPIGAELPQTASLFPRVDKADYLAGTEKAPEPPREESDNLISIDEFFKSQLRVATVKTAERIPKSKKLLELTVDLGDEERTVVAGIAEHYEPEALVGRQVVMVANLQPAKLMGVESQGMVLAASVDGRPVLLHPAEPVADGTPVK